MKELFRIHGATFGAMYFGRSGNNRWDDPQLRFSVLYTGVDDLCAFIETFGHTTGLNLIEESDLDEKSMSSIPVKKSLKLVDLTGSGLARLGADNRLCDCDIEISKKWSRAFHQHPAKPDGILYRARHDPSRRAVAVFSRAKPKLAPARTIVDSFTNPAHAGVLARLLDHYGFGLAY